MARRKNPSRKADTEQDLVPALRSALRAADDALRVLAAKPPAKKKTAKTGRGKPKA